MTVMRATGERPAVCRRFADHQLVHGHGVEMAREGLPLNVIQRQFGRTDLGVTSVYLEGIDNDEVISAVHPRRALMMPASAGLRFPRQAVKSSKASAPGRRAEGKRREALRRAPPRRVRA